MDNLRNTYRDNQIPQRKQEFRVRVKEYKQGGGSDGIRGAYTAV